MLKTVLLTTSIAMAIGMYFPLFRRFAKRHHTRDFSKPYAWMNLLVQVNNGMLAYVEHAPFLIAWYVIQTVFTGLTLWFVYKYWDRPEPRLALENNAEKR